MQNGDGALYVDSDGFPRGGFIANMTETSAELRVPNGPHRQYIVASFDLDKVNIRRGTPWDNWWRVSPKLEVV